MTLTKTALKSFLSVYGVSAYHPANKNAFAARRDTLAAVLTRLCASVFKPKEIKP
jgi:hypothetical protein